MQADEPGFVVNRPIEGMADKVIEEHDRVEEIIERTVFAIEEEAVEEDMQDMTEQIQEAPPQENITAAPSQTVNPIHNFVVVNSYVIASLLIVAAVGIIVMRWIIRSDNREKLLVGIFVISLIALLFVPLFLNTTDAAIGSIINGLTAIMGGAAGALYSSATSKEKG